MFLLNIAIFFRPYSDFVQFFFQYVPHAEDSTLGIVVDSRSDVRNFLIFFSSFLVCFKFSVSI